ncbi:MAG TPA: hypothetical protein VFC24_04835 [Casimicrobiaceae bacterium]|nr:hypothetical protein [Casimicrobiaceae bacterium]
MLKLLKIATLVALTAILAACAGLPGETYYSMSDYQELGPGA